MKKERTRALIERLAGEVEEEDIGIGLFSIFSENEEDLKFFKGNDRERMLHILKVLSEDCKRHKKILERLINQLESKIHEK